MCLELAIPTLAYFAVELPYIDSPPREENVLFLVPREGNLPLPLEDILVMVSEDVSPTGGTVCTELDKPVKLLPPVSDSSLRGVVEASAMVEPSLPNPLSKSLRTS